MDLVEQNGVVLAPAVHNHLLDQWRRVIVCAKILGEHIVDSFDRFDVSAYGRSSGFGDVEEEDEPTRVQGRKSVVESANR